MQNVLTIPKEPWRATPASSRACLSGFQLTGMPIPPGPRLWERRTCRRLVAKTAGILAFVLLLRSDAAGEASPATVFPLKASQNGRYLVDQADSPFLVVGDTAWSLIVQLSEPEIERYLDDRARRGFNAIIVNLLEHKFATKAPAQMDGTTPFLAPGDFTKPNPAYFDYAHRAFAAAQRRGISVWLCPAYLGWGGGDEGFFKEIKAAGPVALRQFGRYVGTRFRDLPNLVWMPGGDYALPPAERWAGEELAQGLRDGGARQLMTAHGGQTSAVETYGDQPWLAIDSVYEYQLDLWEPLRRAWHHRPVRPYVVSGMKHVSICRSIR